MLIKKPLVTKMKVSLSLPADVAVRLEEIRLRASAAGYELDIENAVSGFIEREVRKAEKLIPSIPTSE